MNEGSSEREPGVDRLELGGGMGLDLEDFICRCATRFDGAFVFCVPSCGVFELARVTLEGSGVAMSLCSLPSTAGSTLSSISLSLPASGSKSDAVRIDAPESDSYSAFPQESPRLSRSVRDRALLISDVEESHDDVMESSG